MDTPPPEKMMPSDTTALLRILDAAANRASEGLRVVEDYVRFALDDAHLTEQWKRLRHGLTAALSRIDTAERHAARSTSEDVGTKITHAAEAKRTDLGSAYAASAARLQQALRSLEEYGKLLDPQLGTEIEALRYRSYTLAAAVVTTRTSCELLADIRLCVLLDGCESPEVFSKMATALFRAGVGMIQFRDKTLADRELLARARQLTSLAREHDALAIVNDRVDLAALARADGVHVGQEELSVKDARRLVGTDAIVGVSTHSIAQAQQAVLDGANYIGVGPTFPSQTKSFDDFPGIELLQEVAAEVSLPAFAIGGITATRLPEVQAAGFQRVAVSHAVTHADDPAKAAAQLNDALQQNVETMGS